MELETAAILADQTMELETTTILVKETYTLIA
jgi:hypothetical protein